MTGPMTGPKRPADTVANARHVARIATGEAEDKVSDHAKQAAGQAGATARAESVTPERRREIARKGAAARWGN